MDNENRLDKLENLAEKIIEGLQETREIANSNAIAIQALGDAVTRDMEKAQRDRARLYEAMARMAAAQSHFWQIQEDYYNKLEGIDKTQIKMAEILDKVSQRLDK